MKLQARAKLPTRYGTFDILAYAHDQNEPMPHLALMHAKIDTSVPVLLRIHSECLTGDLMHSLRCDCGPQLNTSLEMIGSACGMLIYLRQEGRGIGLIQKLKAYNLQEEGLDTIEANEKLGFESDPRNFDEAVQILKDLGVKKVRLITNNPDKYKALIDGGIEVVERLKLNVGINEINRAYLQTKASEMGHDFKEANWNS